ncbi:cytochrome P450 [Streptomyces decoyicus]|uniref:cytochrome P450 n=1 Tax=Streptomyces decoyicus TaxID=249567 RepID=UPI0033A413AE
MVEARDPEDGGRGMTDAEISDTILTVFLAGTETTASTLAWALDPWRATPSSSSGCTPRSTPSCAETLPPTPICPVWN